MALLRSGRMHPFASFPHRIPAPTAADFRPQAEAPAAYELDRSRFAVRGATPDDLEDRVETRLEEEDLTVVRAPVEGAGTAAPRDLAPVYTLGEGGAPFVPTGRISARFRDGIRAESRADDLRRLGYRIAEVPPYALHFAWLESDSGDVATALAGLGRLLELEDLVHVEPQMVTPRRPR